MRDDQTFDQENGAAAPLDRSDESYSSDQACGRWSAPGRRMRQKSDLRSRSWTRIENLRSLSRTMIGRFDSQAIKGRLGMRPGRVMVAGGILCCMGLAAFAEAHAAVADELLSQPVADAATQRAEADRRASRAQARTAAPATAAPAADAETGQPDAAALPPDKDKATVVVELEESALPPGHLESGPVAGLSEVQMNNAKAIVWTGVDMRMPRRALVIAVATAMQESNLLNRASEVVPESKRYPHQGTGWDHDSVGLFQQRASTGWGPVKKLMDPAYSSQQFYRGLMRVPGWQNMRLTQAAQAVQISAFPEHYAKHEARATVIVDALTDVD
ncbi:MAG TPA: peptidase M23 [Micromonospora sp.]|nr:peptidase M23 [Micromonospora sp.]